MSSSRDNNAHVKLSRFLSYVLRHKPGSVNLTLDGNGWAGIPELLEKANQHGKPLTRPILEQIVANDDKQRFCFSEDGSKIRANQGHSVGVDLGLIPLEPPKKLYHGTATRFVQSIMSNGLNSRNRNHVHLSSDRDTAADVGRRHGKPVVLEVAAQRMFEDGCLFFRSENGVWLTEEVEQKYLIQIQ